MAQLASEAQSSFDPTSILSFEDPVAKTKEQIRRHYIRALHKVIDESDIVMLVLDARDPEGCRSKLVEEEVRRRESEGKKLIFVLNKIGIFSPSLSFPLLTPPVPRSCTKIECTSMAQTSSAHNPHSSLPLSLILTIPTH
jgi:predicted GTPase